MNKRKVGAKQEEKAVLYLQEQGMKIVETNFYSKQGEIDIIGYQEGYLVFVEVKYRMSDAFGPPEGAVDVRKQKTICKVADYYRYRHNISEFHAVRYDVVAISQNQITWFRNAFMHQGRGYV